uniref:Fc receptor-like protein 5 isoform X2 n=1 Tax=Monopterus albus TaxID=43700 RepID=UPI0009B4A6A1|nr:Fc receptor-like protein 5 isoform X2 [Monopterus albus]
MQLTPFCLMLSCLRVSPDRSQFFMYESISLSCEDQSNSTGWQVKRKTSKGGVRPCASGWGSSSWGSKCIIGNTYPSDSGVYWCESVDGEQSHSVNITITDRTVILEGPTLPVSEGDAVTLRCSPKTMASNSVYHFYKDDHRIGSSSTGEMTIHSAAKSDEGLYKCSVSGGGESVSSLLAVEASHPSSSSPPPAHSCSVSGFRLMRHLVVGTPYLLSTVLLALIYRDRKRARVVAERRGSNDVIMEIVT